MTIRLYWEDPYLTQFNCTVVEVCLLDQQPVAVLDQTAFYPTSGGQPFDTGHLGTARVLNVEEDASGKIMHFLDAQLATGPASGRVDWVRRFDHMQQHTGQHILSQAFVQVAQAPTLSFHMGRETSTIDLNLSHPSEELMEQVEALAAGVVFEDRPVRVHNVRPEDLEALGVRKRSEREGTIRVIDVEGFDRSPCGGTHVRGSGEIGMIAILGYERYKGGTRVEFVCGGRALKTLRKDHDALKRLGKLYSASMYELPDLAEKFFQGRSDLVKQNARLQGEMLEFEARDLWREGVRLGGFVLVRATFSGRSLETVKLLAQKIVAQGEAVAILGLLEKTAQAVVARSTGIPGDCGAIVKDVTVKHGGKGGGRPDLAQAGGIPADNLEAWLTDVERHFGK
ncbi:MAG: hypothetical protein DMG09_02230 [Acidobacteria bacterium]|nr:MAG: hypothetical protein DMG09_02230 [Acidobacteriota bacterium]